MSSLNINLIYFAPCGWQNGIGGGARLKNMMDIFEQLGINIQLISYIPDDKFKINQNQINTFLNEITISIPTSLPKILKAFAIPLIIIKGLKYIRQSDIVFAHQPCVNSGFPAMLLAKFFKKPLIIDHMDVKDPDTPTFIFNSVLNNSTAVFTISHYLKEDVEKHNDTNVVYVPIFIDTNVFKFDLLERNKIRPVLGIGDKDILIGYTGSFWHVEGVPFLINAFSNLVKKHENVKLILIGESKGPNFDNISLILEQYSLKEKVALIPAQPYEAIPKYLSACDIVCSPKIDCEVNRACNPIKPYEYMSMGLITVISTVGDVSNVIENGVNGFLVNPGDEKELEKTLGLIVENLDTMKDVGQKAREEIINNYSQPAMIRRIEAVLKKLTKKNNV